MSTDAAGAREWLDANEISCVRLVGTNHDGLVLGKHMSTTKFLSALERGSPLADTAFGVDLSGEVALGWDWGPWRGEVADIVLMPDPSTLVADPKLNGWASAICDFIDVEGNPLPPCCRGLLKRMAAELGELGYTASVAPEVEFMVFEEPIQEARARRYRDLSPLGGSGRVTYLMTRSRDLSVFVDAVVRRLDALAIPWEYWSSETAPGQVEINLAPTDALTAADHVARTKLAVREVAEEQGRSVTFMAYGIDEHCGGGMHVNLSLQRGGENAFYGDEGGSEVLRRWVAGLLATLPGAMSFLTPNVNSYRRLVDITGPPTTVTWGEDNKSVAVRTVTRDADSSRIEHRVPSGDCNLYLALAAILAGGMVGLEDELDPPPEFDGMAWALPPGTAPKLPGSLKQATAALAADDRLTGKLGRETVEYWLGSREWEWIVFHTHGGDPDSVGDFELQRYFEQV
jgi:glutamine synthetase